MSIEDSDAALRIVEAGRRRVIERLRDAFAHQVGATADLGEVDPAALDGLISQAADRAGASLWRISLAESAADEFGITVGEALTHAAVVSAEQLVGPPDEPEPAPGWAVLPATGDDEPELPEPAAVKTPPLQAADEADDEADDDDGDARTTVSARERLARWQDVAEDEGSDNGVAEETVEAPRQSDPAPAPVAAAPPAAADTGSSPTPAALRIAAVHTGGIETLKAGDKDLELRLSGAGLDVIRRSSGVAIGRLDWTEVTAIEIDEPKKRLRGRKPRALNVRTERGQAGFELPGLTDEEAAEHLEPMLVRLRESGQLGPR
jgi:hypothetical protein